MSYSVHITRRGQWSEQGGPDITLDEWVMLVQSDPDMRLGGSRQWKDDHGKKMSDAPQGLASWQAYSRNQSGGQPVWFEFVSGNVQVINPDQEVMGKMWQLAQKLGARIQGDDGACFDAQGNEIPPDSTMPAKPWWKFWQFDD